MRMIKKRRKVPVIVATSEDRLRKYKEYLRAHGYTPFDMLLEDVYVYTKVPEGRSVRVYKDSVGGKNMIVLVGSKENVEAIKEVLMGKYYIVGHIIRRPTEEELEKILMEELKRYLP